MVSQFSFRFTNLGFGSSLSFFMAQKKTHFSELRKALWILSLTLSLITCLILLFVWKTPLSPWRDFSIGFFLMGLLGVPLYFLQNFLRRFLSGQLRINIANYSEAIFDFSYIPLLIVFVVIFKLGVLGSFLAFLLAQAATCIYLIFHFKSSKIPVTLEAKPAGFFHLCSDMFKYGFWNYWVLLFTTIIQDAPGVLLKYFISNTAVGLYAVSSSAMGRLFMTTNSFAEVLFPHTAASDNNTGIQRTNLLCRAFASVLIIAAIVLGVLIKFIIIFLYGPKFVRSVYVFYALLPSILAYPLFKFLNSHIAATGKSKLSLFSILPGIIFIVGASIFFIPRYGEIGAGLSISGSYMAMFIMNLFLYSKLTGSHFSDILFFRRNDWKAIKQVVKNHWKIIKNRITPAQ
ncbi:MAG: polysaccharide biosynthesis C-terminal domain-containing protein [Thermodesulfobacteriota bacterium]|nr:MAG: polysaccharide biosynthesis C-terminal domain-containing protein [Thermodesulfobacteriota bacterium]